MQDPIEKLQSYLKEASEKLQTPQCQISWHSWPEMFGNTCGPRKGGIGGQSITEFQVFGFYSKATDKGLKCCEGIWKDWNDQKYNWQ
jgi:hypothetical protein